MHSSLVPANTKRSTLILGMFRLVPDIPIVGTGTVLTVILLSLFSNGGTWLLITCLIPMFIGVLLVLPIPNYHNTLCAIQSILGYFNNRRNFIWRGWCIKNEFKDGK